MRHKPLLTLLAFSSLLACEPDDPTVSTRGLPSGTPADDEVPRTNRRGLPKPPQAPPAPPTLPSPPKDTLPLVGDEGVNEAGYPRQLPDLIALRALLQERRFDELEAHMAAYQDRFRQDAHYERWPDRALDAFGIADPKLEGLLGDWIAAAPKSAAAHAALGAHLAAKAWDARGHESAAETSGEAMAAFSSGMGKAAESFTKSTELQPDLVAAHRRLMLTAIVTSADDETIGKHLNTGLEHCPTCVNIRRSYMDSLEPRWGGSNEALQSYANKHRLDVRTNPRLALLQAEVHRERCRQLRMDKNYPAALTECTKAVDAYPDEQALAARAAVHRKLDKLDLALADADAALEASPQNETALQQRYYILGTKQDAVGAARALVTLRQLDPYSTWLADNLPVMQERLYVERDHLFSKSRLDDARTRNDLLLELDPGDKKAQKFARESKPAENLPALREAVEADANDFKARQKLDAALIREGKFDEIIAMWDAYIETHPDDARAFMERGGTKQRARRYPAAVADFDSACELGDKRGCSIAERGRKAIEKQRGARKGG